MSSPALALSTPTKATLSPSGIWASTAITGNAGLLGGRHGRLHAVDVDGDQHDAVDLLGDVVLDRVVLRARHVVGVEDDELVAARVRRLLGAVVDLVEEQSLLVDRDERIGARLRRRGSRQNHRQGSPAQQHRGQAHLRSPLKAQCDTSSGMIGPRIIQATKMCVNDWAMTHLLERLAACQTRAPTGSSTRFWRTRSSDLRLRSFLPGGRCRQNGKAGAMHQAFPEPRRGLL